MKIYDYGGKKNICGDRIREARVVQRMSQNELAAKMQVEGITIERDSISRVEIGTRFVADYELKVFAKVLNVKLILRFGASFLSIRESVKKYHEKKDFDKNII